MVNNWSEMTYIVSSGALNSTHSPNNWSQHCTICTFNSRSRVESACLRGSEWSICITEYQLPPDWSAQVSAVLFAPLSRLIKLILMVYLYQYCLAHSNWWFFTCGKSVKARFCTVSSGSITHQFRVQLSGGSRVCCYITI